PMFLLVQAKRLYKADIFATAPQQSDYVASWTDERFEKTAVPSRKSATSVVKRILPEFIKRPIRNRMIARRQAAHFKITNQVSFQPIDFPSEALCQPTPPMKSKQT